MPDHTQTFRLLSAASISVYTLVGLLFVASCTKEGVEVHVKVGVPQVQQQPVSEAGETVASSEPENAMEVEAAVEAPQWSQANTQEERRANLDQALATAKEPYYIDMHDLGGWILDEREDSPIPDYILALDGKEFVMRGFLMPDIDFEHIREFHLVRSLYSCCFGAPPQLNEIVRVSLADEDGMDYTYNTVEIRGRLHIVFEVVDGLVEDIFRIEDATYRVLDFDDPGAPINFNANTGFNGVVPSGTQEY